MKLLQTTRRRAEFDPVLTTGHAQAAIMQLQPGGESDEELSNEHPASEQWVYVVAGTGVARVVGRNGKRRSLKIRSGSLLVIERGELHQIKNTGTKPLNTINIYVPPAYRSDGRVLRRAKH